MVFERMDSVSKDVLRMAARGLVPVALVLLAGCSTSDTQTVLDPGAVQDTGGQEVAAVDPVANATVVQASCPRVELREGTAYFRTYAKGGDGDPQKVIHQASFSDTNRQCRLSGGDMIMTVQATGRVVAGPAGGPGTVNLPVRVAVTDGDTVLYSELQRTDVSLPDGAPTAQFLFTNSTVTFPAASARAVKVFVGFDPGPYNTP